VGGKGSFAQVSVSGGEAPEPTVRGAAMNREVRDSPSAAPKGDACGRTPAIPLNARRTQTSEAMGLESVHPREELFLRQLIDLAGLLGA
jgi:hypothetical protein